AVIVVLYGAPAPAAGSASGSIATIGDCPASLRPQHTGIPSLRTAQVFADPASTSLNVPAGGVAWPSAFAPQQATVASSLTAQVWALPALSCLNTPAGDPSCPPLLL